MNGSTSAFFNWTAKNVLKGHNTQYSDHMGQNFTH